MTLNQLPTGISSRVIKVALSVDQHEVRGQLEDIGFLPGEQVQVLRRGLFDQGTLLVRVGSSTFALRQSEAQMIEVELLAV